MNDEKSSEDESNPLKVSQDASHSFGITLVCFCILIFWIGGIGACSSLGMIGAKVVYPIISSVVIIGMFVGIAKIFRNENTSNTIGFFKHILLFTCVATVLIFSFTMLFIFGH